MFNMWRVGTAVGPFIRRHQTDNQQKKKIMDSNNKKGNDVQRHASTLR